MARKNWLRNMFPKWVVGLHDKAYYAYIQAFPKRHAANMFHESFGRPIDWNHPTILSEKGRWVQFNTNTTEWPLLADKIRVRDYLKNLGLEEYLPALYGVWEKAADIDFASLPGKFVLKTNHGCGEVVVVSDKSAIDEKALRRKMQHYLDESYGVWTAEPHYLKIKPVILAEQLLPNTSPDSEAMVDYKVFCSWGQPILLDICYDRNPDTHHANETWYDPDWTKHDEWHTGNYKPKNINRPASLDEMYEICKKLSHDKPLMRIDFYDVNGRPYIGELTMTPNGYNPECLTDEAQRIIGDRIDLSSLLKK